MVNVFITGASSGLGRALAQYYAQAGARLGLVSRRGEILRAVAETLPGAHHCYPLDVRDRPALHAAAQDFLDVCGGNIDVVIASAGISAGTLTEAPEDFAVFKAIVDTNLLATMATFEPFLEPMNRQGEGRLAAIASVAGIRGLPGAGAYSASKAGVIAYGESLRLELAPHGIRVITLAPGFIKTAMTEGNPYFMPFLMDADAFAARAARAIARGVSYKVIPWQMGLIARLMRALPNGVYDWLASNAPRKPRQAP